MSSEDKVIALKEILSPIIVWYKGVLADGEPDESYLYDMTYEHFNNLSRGEFLSIIEVLLGKNPNE